MNPDQNIFSINVELTSTFYTLQRFGPSTSPNFKSLNNFEDRAGQSPPLTYKEDKNEVFSVNALVVSCFMPNKYHICG